MAQSMTHESRPDPRVAPLAAALEPHHGPGYFPGTSDVTFIGKTPEDCAVQLLAAIDASPDIALLERTSWEAYVHSVFNPDEAEARSSHSDVSADLRDAGVVFATLRDHARDKMRQRDYTAEWWCDSCKAWYRGEEFDRHVADWIAALAAPSAGAGIDG